jgi:hypothetical protein
MFLRQNLHRQQMESETKLRRLPRKTVCCTLGFGASSTDFGVVVVNTQPSSTQGHVSTSQSSPSAIGSQRSYTANKRSQAAEIAAQNGMLYLGFLDVKY